MPRDRLDADELDKYLTVLEACHTDAQVDRLVSWLDNPDGPLACLRCGVPTWHPDRRAHGLGICPDCGNTRERFHTLAELLSDRPRTPRRPACSGITVQRLTNPTPICVDCGRDHTPASHSYPGRIPPSRPQYDGLFRPTRPSPFRPPEWR